MEFPAQIYVRHFDDEGELFATRTEAEAIEEDGPTEVAEYQLVNVRTLQKKVEQMPPDGK